MKAELTDQIEELRQMIAQLDAVQAQPTNRRDLGSLTAKAEALSKIYDWTAEVRRDRRCEIVHEKVKRLATTTAEAIDVCNRLVEAEMRREPRQAIFARVDARRNPKCRI